MGTNQATTTTDQPTVADVIDVLAEAGFSPNDADAPAGTPKWVHRDPAFAVRLEPEHDWQPTPSAPMRPVEMMSLVYVDEDDEGFTFRFGTRNGVEFAEHRFRFSWIDLELFRRLAGSQVSL